MSAANPTWEELSASFTAAIAQPIRVELQLEAAPGPARLATHTLALLADLFVGEEAIGSGRLVLLNEPKYQPEWDGQTRFVGYLKADLESELVTDPLLLDVGWSWVRDSFADRDLHPVALSGTVSRTGNQSFGDISSRPATGAIEIRSSWTMAAGEDVTLHVAAWCELLALACGLEPLPAGVAQLRTRH